MKLPDGKSRIDLVKAGLTGNVSKRGRMVVNIGRILEDPKNERKTFRNMNGLVESIRAVGLVEPITVTPEGESYRILTGHRRFRAAKEAGLHEVEILIREPEADLMRRRKSVVSNVQREDVGIIELAEALKDLLENDPTIRTQRELSRIIGKTESWLSDVLRVLTLPADIRTKLRTSEVAVPYDSAIRIARAANPITQRSLVELALKGASVAEIRQRAKSIAKKSTAPGVKFQTTKQGYTAIVQGPAAPGANEKMVATLKALIEQVKNQLN